MNFIISTSQRPANIRCDEVQSSKRGSRVVRRFVPILAMSSLCWVLLIFDQVLWQGQLAQHGIVPRHLSSLPGILWSPFLHGSFRHLAANSPPLFILGAFICARSKGEFIAV